MAGPVKPQRGTRSVGQRPLNALEAFHTVVRPGFCKPRFRVIFEFGAERCDLLVAPQKNRGLSRI
jgi:hypothetical protein